MNADRTDLATLPEGQAWLKQARVNPVNNDLEPAMTRFTRAARAVAPALTALTILAATVPASTPAAARSNFDGKWSVLIVTQRGTCDRAYRYPVKIDNGAVGYAGDSAFTVSGKVGQNGAVTVKVARGRQSANGQGRLSSTDGSGMWIASSGECSGTWTAERRS
jgi:hypothetical protein